MVSEVILLQVCTLLQHGKLTIWTVVTTSKLQSSQMPNDQGLAYWGSIRLVAGTTTELSKIAAGKTEDFECYDLQIDGQNSNHLYIVTNLPIIIHCLISGTKTTPKFYETDSGKWSSKITDQPFLFIQ